MWWSHVRGTRAYAKDVSPEHLTTHFANKYNISSLLCPGEEYRTNRILYAWKLVLNNRLSRISMTSSTSDFPITFQWANWKLWIRRLVYIADFWNVFHSRPQHIFARLCSRSRKVLLTYHISYTSRRSLFQHSDYNLHIIFHIARHAHIRHMSTIRGYVTHSRLWLPHTYLYMLHVQIWHTHTSFRDVVAVGRQYREHVRRVRTCEMFMRWVARRRLIGPGFAFGGDKWI